MTAELDRAFTTLGHDPGKDNQLPPYFLSYTVTDASSVTIQAQYGALISSIANHARVADIQVRLGGPQLDNTHGDHRGSAVKSVQLPLSDDQVALERTLWLTTNNGYSNALDNYLRVKTEAQVRAKEEDTSPDFSAEKAQISIGSPAPPVRIDRAAWEQRVAALSRIFREYPDVYQNMVVFTVQNQTEYFASSEGSRIITPHVSARLVILAVTRADDGMELFRDQTFEAETADGLPSQAQLESAVRSLGSSLEALRKAPITEPFDGPSILSGRAAAVFFHEVLVGVSFFTEAVGAGPRKHMDILGFGMADGVELRIHPTGTAVLRISVQTQGQGHETTFAQIVAEELGVSPDDVEVVHGDTDQTPFGLGTYGSRSTPVSGAATAMVARKVRERARIVASAMLEVDPADLEWERGRWSSGVTRTRAARWWRSRWPRTLPWSCRKASRGSWTRPASTTRPTSPTRSARTSAWSTWMRAPARSASGGSSRWTTAGCGSTR